MATGWSRRGNTAILAGNMNQQEAGNGLSAAVDGEKLILGSEIDLFRGVLDFSFGVGHGMGLDRAAILGKRSDWPEGRSSRRLRS